MTKRSDAPSVEWSRPLVTADWLQLHLGRPGLKVLDGTFHTPDKKRDARAEFRAGHIPGAVFFDIDRIADDTPAPPSRMLPKGAIFAREVGELGLGPGDAIVVYDTIGMYSAARVWWMFRSFGHRAVAVLDGGLPAWTRAGGALETGEPAIAHTVWPQREPLPSTRDWRQILDNISTRREQLVDVRPPEIFNGDAGNIYAGVRSGHIPGAVNVSQRTLLNPDGTFREPAEIDAIVRASGIDPEKPIVATCGSGVTACILSLALELTGHGACPIYDGSWEEWGVRRDLPVEISG